MYESKMRNNNQPGTGANHTCNQIITVMAWAVVTRAPWILSLSPTLGWIAWGVWADATVAGVEGGSGTTSLQLQWMGWIACKMESCSRMPVA